MRETGQRPTVIRASAGGEEQVASARVRLHDETVEVDGEAHRILVVTPTDRIVIGRDRLDRIRAGDARSIIDELVLDRARTWTPRIEAVVFVAHDGEDRCWSFAADLGPEEIDELGYEMVRAQLALYRGLLDAGIHALTGIALPAAEHAAFVRGTERLAAEIERELQGADRARASVLRLDLWLLDHLALWTPASPERFFAAQLPELLSLLQRRRRQIRDMHRDVVDSGEHSLPPR
jgi:hypothetical protein